MASQIRENSRRVVAVALAEDVVVVDEGLLSSPDSALNRGQTNFSQQDETGANVIKLFNVVIYPPFNGIAVILRYKTSLLR
jgi:hypothetical protein